MVARQSQDRDTTNNRRAKCGHVQLWLMTTRQCHDAANVVWLFCNDRLWPTICPNLSFRCPTASWARCDHMYGHDIVFFCIFYLDILIPLPMLYNLRLKLQKFTGFLWRIKFVISYHFMSFCTLYKVSCFSIYFLLLSTFSHRWDSPFNIMVRELKQYNLIIQLQSHVKTQF